MKRLPLWSLALSLGACSAVAVPGVGREFDLLIHTRVRVEGTPFFVAFDSVLEDSRCPSDVVCIQAGRAAVLVSVTYASGPDIVYALRFTDRPDSSTALVEGGGWFVDFIGLFPYPTVAAPPDPRTRVARLQVRLAAD